MVDTSVLETAKGKEENAGEQNASGSVHPDTVSVSPTAGRIC